MDGVLQANSSNAAVLSQTLTMDAGLDEQARTSNISTGKAALVNQVLELNDQLAYTRLAKLSVEELKDLIKIGAPAMPIGKSEAGYAAEKYAGTLEVESTTTEVDPELDDPIPHYEVELRWGEAKWEYTVDAWTGEVLSGTPNILDGMTAVTVTSEEAKNAALAHIKESFPQADTSQAADVSVELKTDWTRPQYVVKLRCGSYEFEYQIDAYNSTQMRWSVKEDGRASVGGSISLGYAIPYITQEQAKQAALDHAGVQESQVTKMKVELDKEDGHAVYEVEFTANGTEYEYEIDAGDGAVWKYESETKGVAPASAPAFNGVGESGAKAAALNHAGFAEKDTTYCNAWTEYENGRPDHYQVEFAVGTVKYEYEIGLTDGAVLSCEQEQRQNPKDNTSSTSSDIGESGAKTAAFQHAGVSESQVSKLKVKQDWDDGRLEYEVEFKAGGMEYEYTIDGSSGAILEHEMDRDD